MNMKKVIALICAIAIMVTGMGYVPGEVKAEKTTKEKSKATIQVDDVEDLQSDHPYPSATSDKTWVYESNDAAELKVTFSSLCSLETNGDYVYVYDKYDNKLGTYTGTQLKSVILRVPGDTVKIRLVTDDTGNDYGFKVDSVVKMQSISVTKNPTEIGRAHV